MHAPKLAKLLVAAALVIAALAATPLAQAGVGVPQVGAHDTPPGPGAIGPDF